MRVAAGAPDLDPRHAEAAVLDLLDRAGDGVVEGRPAAVRVELVVARVERRAAGPALVHAVDLGVDILAGPGCLGPGLAEDAELLRAEPDPPLVLGGGQGGVVRRHAVKGTSMECRRTRGAAVAAGVPVDGNREDAP